MGDACRLSGTKGAELGEEVAGAAARWCSKPTSIHHDAQPSAVNEQMRTVIEGSAGGFTVDAGVIVTSVPRVVARRAA